MGLGNLCQVCISGTVTQPTLPVIDIGILCFLLPEVNGEVIINLADSPLITFLAGQGLDAAAIAAAIAIPPFSRPCPSGPFPINVELLVDGSIIDLALTVIVNGT